LSCAYFIQGFRSGKWYFHYSGIRKCLTAADNALDLEDAKYVRVTNLDDTNPIELAIVGAATLYQVRLAAGESHILGAPDDLMLAEADTSPSFGTMADIASIQVNPASNDVDVEILVASV